MTVSHNLGNVGAYKARRDFGHHLEVLIVDRVFEQSEVLLKDKVPVRITGHIQTNI